MIPKTSNEDGGLKMSDVVTGEVKYYLDYQRWYWQTMEQFLELEAENARLKKAIQTADVIEIANIKKELDND